MLGKDALCFVVSVFYDRVYLGVDLCRDLLGVVGRAREISAEKYLILIASVFDRTEHIAHAELRDHFSCNCGRTLDIVRGTSRYIAEYNLFRGSAAEKLCDALLELVFIFAVLVFLRGIERISESSSAWDDRDLLNRRAAFKEECDDRVSRLVECGLAAL